MSSNQTSPDGPKVSQLKQQVSSLYDQATKSRTKLMSACEILFDKNMALKRNRAKDVQLFHQNWDRILRVLKEYQINHEKATDKYKNLKVSKETMDQELIWYMERCQILEAEVDNIVELLQEQILRRNLLEKGIDEWNEQNDMTTFKISEHFKDLQNSFFVLKTATERDLKDQQNSWKNLNAKVLEAIQSFACTVESEKKDLQFSLERTTEEKSLIQQQLKKTEKELNKLKKELNEVSKVNQNLHGVMAKQNDALTTAAQQMKPAYRTRQSKEAERMSKAIRQMAHLVAQKNPAFRSAYTEFEPQSLSFNEGLVEALEVTLTKSDAHHQLLQSSIGELETKVDVLQSDLEREVSAKMEIEREIESLKQNQGFSLLRLEAVSNEKKKLKKVISNGTTERDILKKTLHRLEERNNKLLTEIELLRNQHHQVELQNNSDQSRIAALELDLKTCSKNLSLSELKVEEMTKVTFDLRSRLSAREEFVLNFKHDRERDELYRNEEKYKMKHRIGCVDPDIPLDVQLLFYK